MNDDIDNLLAGRVLIAPSDTLRQSVLRQTRGVVRRRRIARRVGFVGMLLAVYAAGAMTMRVTQTPKSTDVPMATNETTAPTPAPKATEATPTSLIAMEWQAIDSTQGRADLFRKVGDRYLADDGDVESALRCYRNALDAGSAADTAIRPDDSWLMISLKQAKLKEKHNDLLDS